MTPAPLCAPQSPVGRRPPVTPVRTRTQRDGPEHRGEEAFLMANVLDLQGLEVPAAEAERLSSTISNGC
ncbi:hypothetical protein GCM10020256_15490 [Streptomyces thermocoprophilus]